MGFTTSSLILCVVCLALTASGYKVYQTFIPNGENIVDPENKDIKWGGVGHMNGNGGGPRNPFGKDFAANGHVWNYELCSMDSDKDGMSNGQELGDPFCQWTQGQNPSTEPKSHPGICEPIYTDHCKEINKGIDFEGSKPFNCPATKDEKVTTTDLRLTKTQVPPTETNYFCQYFPLNIAKNVSEHIIAFEPILDNENVIHHIIAYGCRDRQAKDVPVEHMAAPISCSESMLSCFEIVALWGVGVNGICYGDYGGRIGQGGYTGIWLEAHWNNPMEMAGMYDSSGLRLYHTPDLRPVDAAFVLWGPQFFNLPPGQKEVSATGVCPSSRTWDIEGRKYITIMSPHMHLLGRRMKVVHIRHGSFERVLLEENNFDYNDPLIMQLEEHIEFHPGDEIKVTCTWNTEGKDEETVFGESTQDEMCFFVAQIYPFDQSIPVFCGEYQEPASTAHGLTPHAVTVLLALLILAALQAVRV